MFELGLSKKRGKCSFHINESRVLKFLRAVNITLKAPDKKDDVVTNLLPAFLFNKGIDESETLQILQAFDFFLLMSEVMLVLH